MLSTQKKLHGGVVTDKERIAELEQEARDLHEAVRLTERALYILMGYSYVEPGPWDPASAIQTGKRDKAETGYAKKSAPPPFEVGTCGYSCSQCPSPDCVMRGNFWHASYVR